MGESTREHDRSQREPEQIVEALIRRQRNAGLTAERAAEIMQGVCPQVEKWLVRRTAAAVGEGAITEATFHKKISAFVSRLKRPPKINDPGAYFGTVCASMFETDGVAVPWGR